MKRSLISIATLILVALSLSTISAVAAPEAPKYDLLVHVPGALPKSPSVTVSLASNPGIVASTSRAIGTDSYGWFGVVEVPAAAGNILVKATGLNMPTVAVDPINSPEVWLDPSGNSQASELLASGKLTFLLTAAAGSKTNRFIELVADGVKYTADFNSKLVATINVPTSTKEFTFKTKLKVSAYRSIDTSLEMTADASKNARFYLSDNYEGYRLGAAYHGNKAVIHYKRQDNKYTGWTIHVQNDSNFGGALKPTTWAKSQAPDSAKPDSWGIKFTIALAEGSTMLPFTIHKGNLADPVDRDQLMEIAVTGGEIWIESGKVDADGKILTSNPITLVNTDVSGPTLSEAQSLTGETDRSSFANDSIYFVMFDRYKNGDTTNDRGGLVGDFTQTGYLPTDWAYSHGGDLKGLADGCERNDGSGDGIPRIKRLGFTAVWISPPFVQNFVQSGSSAYHGYFVTDFTKIDPHWGTNADFKNVSDCAHRLGMKVILDIVVNHTGDIIQYGASNNYDGSVNQTAYIPAGQENAKWPAFLNDLANYHNMGPIRNWSNKGEYQNGDFGGLDDVKTENQAVVDGFADVYSMWVNDYGVDGFRIDTAKHVDDQFFTRWFNAMEQRTQATMTAKGQKLFAFGEYYDGSTSTLSGYIHKQGLPSVLDFAFQPAAVGFAQGGDATVLANVFKADNDYLTPNKSAYNLINFLGNHDMGRAAYLLRGGLSIAQLRKADLLAHDVMFLTRGIPSIFYGDEVGMLGGGDKAARQDMFSTMVKTWKEEERVWGDPIGIQNSYNIVTPLSTRLTLLNKLRKDHPALASGAQWLRLQSGKVMVNSRIDQSNRIEYLVAFNSGSKEKKVTVQTSTLSSSWTALLGSAKVTSDKEGKVELTVPAQGTLVLKADKALPIVTSSPKVRLTVRAGNDAVQLAAAVRSLDPGSVSWAVKVNDGAWEKVGTDDAGLYSMDWDYNTNRVNKIQAGDKLTFVAIFKNTSGGLSISRPEKITIK